MVSASSANEVIAVVDKDAKVVDSSEALSIRICSVVESVIGTVVICDIESCVVGVVIIVSLDVVPRVMSLLKIVEVSLTNSSEDVVDDSTSVECDIEFVVE